LSAATSLTQFGITWSFDRDYRTGQFANGDHWVVGPVTITKISPNDTNLSDSSDIHGSMVNPAPDVSAPYTQGWDSRIKNTAYDGSLNVARKLPLRLQAGSSLVSVSSYSSVPTDRGLYLKDAAVLTVLAAVPPDDSFRPPYSGTDKSIPGTVDDLNFTILRTFAPVSNTPALSSFDGKFEQPMIDIVGQWENSHVKNAGAGPNYGRDIAMNVGDAVLSLNLNYSNAQKRPLFIKIVQRGIDTYGLAKAGMDWFPNGGHNTGRKLPLLIAGKALGHADMLAWGDAKKHFIFQEDTQHWYIDQTDVKTKRGASDMTPYSSSMIGLPEWASDPLYQRHQTSSGWNKSYRIVNGVANTGLVLAAEIMGLRDEWNREVFFDYHNDRFWPKEGVTPTSSQKIPVFHRNMWLAYRNSKPSEIEVDNTTTEGIWQNIAFAAQTKSFNCSFDMIPSSGKIEGVTGLSQGAADHVDDLAAAIRFSSNGRIEARNGSTYQAAKTVNYSAGLRYRVELTIDFATRKYSATVAPQGGAATTIAQNYSFPSSKSGITKLDRIGFCSTSGAHSVVGAKVSSLVEDIVDVITPPDPSPSKPATSALDNGSFENGVSEWTSSGNIEAIATSSRYPATDGNRLLTFNSGQSTANGTLTQKLSTTAGVSYTLSFDLGVFSFNKNEQRLSVTATGSKTLLSQVAKLSGKGGGNTVWKKFTYTFVANSSTTTITLKDVSTTTKDLDMLLDNVRITSSSSSSPAPAPAPAPVPAPEAPKSLGFTNGSFENGVADWSSSGNFTLVATSSRYPATDGGKLLSFNGGQTTPNATLSQSLSTTAGKTYIVTFDLGAFGFNKNEQRLSVTAQGSKTVLSKVASLQAKGNGSTTWKKITYTFVADSSTTKLVLKDVSKTTKDIDMLLDNVRVSL
jgi:hypothetical protein